MDERISDVQGMIRHMANVSGMSYAEISRAMGRNDRYIAVMLNEGTTPRLDLFVKIAETCGYAVELRQVQDYDSWELAVDNGKVVALKEHGHEDMEQLSQMQEDAREAMKDLGRQEVIDSLIEYLQGLKEQ